MGGENKTREINGYKIECSESHRYKINGTPVKTSVTGACGIIDKPALQYWAVDETIQYLSGMTEDEIIQRIREAPEGLFTEARKASWKKAQEAKDIGTLTHSLIEQYLIDPGLEIKLDDKPDEVKHTLSAFFDFMDKEKIQYDRVECEVLTYHPDIGYIGTLDVKLYSGDEIILLDWKTGAQKLDKKTGKPKRRLYWETDLQVAAYIKAEEKLTGQMIQKGIAVFLGKDGSGYECKKYSQKDIDKNFQYFLSALNLKRGKMEDEALHK